MGKAGQKTKAGRILPDKPLSKVFTVEQEQDIGRRWLRSEPAVSIARVFQVDVKTIYRLVHERLRPLWREINTRPKDDMMAELAELKRVAWKGYQDTFLGLAEESVEEGIIKAAGGNISIGLIKRVTRKLTNNTATAWLSVIQWCLDFEAKIHGHYAPTRSHLQIDGNFRVAGAAPNVVNEEMGRRLIERLAASRARAAELKTLGIEGS